VTARRLPLRLETIESRLAPAIFNVTNLADSGTGSLRQAILDANSNGEPDVIDFQVSGTIAMTNGEMAIFNDLTIVGPGSGLLTIDAQGKSRIFNIENEGTVHASISGMNLINGLAGQGGGGAIEVGFGTIDLHLSDVSISNCQANRGGAVDINGSNALVVDNCNLTGNTSTDRGGAVFLGSSSNGQFRDSTISGNQAVFSSGGGIYADVNAAVSIERCIIVSNSTTTDFSATTNGGGIFIANSGSLNLLDSLVANNVAANGEGGGIAVSQASFTINNSTISSNTAGSEGGGIYSGGTTVPLTAEILHTTVTENFAVQTATGGGLFTDRNVDVANSIFAHNTATPGPDIFTANSSTINLAFSLILDPSGATINDLGGNIMNQDPLLGPLANNGGKTQTHALQKGSPAIDAGDPAFQNPPAGTSVPVNDQRGTGFARVVGGRTDMGACEFVPAIIPPPPVRPVNLVAVGSGPGGDATVHVYDNSGKLLISFQPYDTSFKGEIHVATGDINGDGIEDVVTGAGPGGGPHVQAFDGKMLMEGKAERIVSALGSYFAYNPGFRGGVNVAIGDVNGDGKADIITGAGAGGGPHVIAWDVATGKAISSFYAYDPGFRGGVNVGAGDFFGDGRDEIVTGAGPGGGPHVRVFDHDAVVKEFFAYDANFHGGVYVAAGDITGDGKADIVTGAGAGGGPHVKVFDGTTLAMVRSFFAFVPEFTGGVRVAVGNLDNDADDEIIVGAGPLGGPHVRFVDNDVNNTQINSFYAFDPNFNGGVFVG
jgi:hypothetical protein